MYRLFFVVGLVVVASGARAQQYTISTLAGNGTYGSSGDGGPATKAGLYFPTGVAVDMSGNLYIADQLDSQIRKVSPLGIITTVAGGGSGGSGDVLNNPYSVAVDGSGNLYIADTLNNRVRRVSTSGIITTVASVYQPYGIVVDRSGNIYVSDDARLIQKISPTSGAITTVAGNGVQGYSGDGGPATSAELSGPAGIAMDNAGNIYVADQSNQRVRMVSASGTITTVAGNGVSVDSNGVGGFSGDGGPATAAELNQPGGVAVDGSGNLYIGDGANHRLRKVSSTGIITTIAGTGTAGFSGDGGLATAAELEGPAGIVTDGAGNVYFADVASSRVRLLQPIPTFASSAVVNAASYLAGSVAPGEIITLFGSGLGPSTLSGLQLNAAGVVSSSLADTEVLFDSIPAPMVFAQSAQLSAVVPYEIGGKTSTQLLVSFQGVLSTPVTMAVANAAPGIFTTNSSGQGQGAIVNQDGTVNSAGNPAAVGSYISIYGTGDGQTSPAGVDGKLGGNAPALTLQKVSATIGGLNAPVQYSGGVFGLVAGVFQINIQIPQGVTPGGVIPLTVQIGSVQSATVTVAIR